jgi:hypothetical protein
VLNHRERFMKRLLITSLLCTVTRMDFAVHYLPSSSISDWWGYAQLIFFHIIFILIDK